jgi:hypothetical protein
MLGWGVNRTLALATIGKRDFFVEPLRMGLLLVARALVLFMAISSQKVPRLQKLTKNKVCSEQAGGEFYSWFSASWG